MKIRIEKWNKDKLSNLVKFKTITDAVYFVGNAGCMEKEGYYKKVRIFWRWSSGIVEIEEYYLELEGKEKDINELLSIINPSIEKDNKALTNKKQEKNLEK